MQLELVKQCLEKVRQVNPLVHHITNVVVTNFTANGLLALGASPVMAYAKQEVAEMARIAGALVLNIGTLNETEVEAMLIAGRSANEHGVPVVLDPVGAGATQYRTQTARMIMEQVDISMIRGNAAEIAHVLGEKWEIKGVDAGQGDQDVSVLAQKAARQWGTTVVITGKEDVITDGERILRVGNGHAMLTKVTGTGCLLSSVIGTFMAVESDTLVAGAAALVCYGVAAEKAAEKAADEGPGSFQIQFLNELYKIDGTDVLRMGKLKR